MISIEIGILGKTLLGRVTELFNEVRLYIPGRIQGLGFRGESLGESRVSSGA